MGEPAAPRFVEVAIDAAGAAGARTWTYSVPAALADLVPGEAVLADWGNRRALAIVLADAPAPPDGVAARPVADRVRTDGPLLPGLTLALVREIAAHYIAPPALVVRATLPPEFLERLELVATPLGGPPVNDPADAALIDALATGAHPVRGLPAPDGRPALLRRLRALEATGRLHLEWALTEPGARPRFERVVRPTAAGLAVAAGDRPPDGRALGLRQRALLEELLAVAPGASPDGAGAIPAPELAARHGSGTLPALARRGLLLLETRESERRPLGDRAPGRRGARPTGTALTAPQAEAVALIAAALAAHDATPLLLDGVTGGGKSAIYVEALAACLAAGRPALILVPEIALALPLVDRIRAELGAEVALLHSALGAGERADEWRRIRGGAVEIVVGTRLAVLAPLADVGLVIVDEEHEATYKSDRTPRLQARDMALCLARLAGAAAVLGSATPAVETVGNVRLGRYRRVALPERPSGAPPAVELVDLRAELAAGNRGLLSAHLAAALGGLDPAAGERAILVINRRGTATVVLCRDCGHVQACPECTLPLVYHHAGLTLRCHHCGAAAPIARRCPACRSPRIRYLGGGTERLETEVRDRFPAFRVGRLDRDVVERKGAAARVVDAFADGRLDVLVGTSLVTKGLDVPEVTLVGIVSADVALNLPDERAAERTYQLLVQAVGRAGRGERPGRAIIQTYQPDHPAIRAVVAGDAAAFYDAELALREHFGGPPFGRNLKLTVGLEDPVAARREASAMADGLRARAAERGARVEVIGPAPAYVPRRAGRWRWNVVLRGDDPVGLLDGEPGPPWSVDVDPESLL